MSINVSKEQAEQLVDAGADLLGTAAAAAPENSFGQGAATIGSAALTGASMGAAAGPWGAAVGAVAGIIIGSISVANRAKRVRQSTGPFKISRNDLKALQIEAETGAWKLPGSLAQSLVAAKAAGRQIKLKPAAKRWLKRQG